MSFYYKIAFFTSFDYENQKWIIYQNNILIEKYGKILSGSGELAHEFFYNLVLNDIIEEECIKITSRLFNHLPSFYKFSTRVYKHNEFKNIDKDELMTYWKNMRELFEFILENKDDNIQWYLVYNYKK
jgi:hypothetical protein